MGMLARRQHTGMIKSQSEHHSSEDNHNDRPGIEYRIFGRTFVFIFQETGQIDQQTCTDNLGYVIKSTLPTYILSLFLCIQLVHIYPVTGHIVRCPAKGDNGEQGDSDCKKGRKMKPQGNQPESDSRYHLGEDDKEFLGTVHLQQRTPKGFQCPGKHDKGGPEGYFRITDSQTFVHQYSYHIEDNKREPHTKISGGNPKNRTTASGRSWGFGCFHLYLSIKVVEFGYNRR